MVLDTHQITHSSNVSTFGKPSVRKLVPFWKRLPRMFNQLFHMIQHAERKNTANLQMDYDPFLLKILCNQRYIPNNDNFYAETLKNDKQLFDRISNKEIDLESFKMTLEQMPGIRTIEFTGRGEPLLNPDLFAMIRYAHQKIGAECIVQTQGHLLDESFNALQRTPLKRLVVQLYGHKPSTYHQMCGLDAKNFLSIVNQVRRLVMRNKNQFEIWVSFIVDLHTFKNTPEILSFANQLGVDGVIIENFLSSDSDIASPRSLYTDQQPVVELLQHIHDTAAQYPNMQIVLPTLLDRDMRQHRNCRDAFTTVTIDGNCTAYPCSRQSILSSDAPKIWDLDFWNHRVYRNLRATHGSANPLLLAQREATGVPLPCRHCPHNMAQHQDALSIGSTPKADKKAEGAVFTDAYTLVNELSEVEKDNPKKPPSQKDLIRQLDLALANPPKAANHSNPVTIL